MQEKLHIELVCLVFWLLFSVLFVLFDSLTLFSAGSRRSSSVNPAWRPPRPGSVGYVPWRTAARADLQRYVSEMTLGIDFRQVEQEVF